MSQKFSFLIIIESNGNLTTKAYNKEDAQVGLNDFAKARESGKEAHFYHCPKADKRCKSAAARDALERYTDTDSKEEPKVVEEQASKTSKKSSKSESKALDLE
jgi:hypothetical protein